MWICRVCAVPMDKLSITKSNHFGSFKSVFLFIHRLNQINFAPGKINYTYMLWWCEQKMSETSAAAAAAGMATVAEAAAAIDVKRMCCMIYYFIQITKGTHFESHMNIIKRHFNYPCTVSKRSQFANFGSD